jgi:hypothetical protein
MMVEEEQIATRCVDPTILAPSKLLPDALRKQLAETHFSAQHSCQEEGKS